MKAGTALKICAHLAALASLCLAFSGAMFLGLQVAPLYGDIGIGVTVALAALYAYFGFIRKSPVAVRARDRHCGTSAPAGRRGGGRRGPSR